VVIYQYLDQFGNQNGVFSEEDWEKGIDLLNARKMKFYYNLDMIVAMLDADENDIVNEGEMEEIISDLCVNWHFDLKEDEPEEPAEEDPAPGPEKVCDDEPEANSVTYDKCEMEQDLFKAFFYLSD
jgi:hypothetical protein